MKARRGYPGAARYRRRRADGRRRAPVVANLNKYNSEIAECGGELTVLRDYEDWGAIDIGVDASIPAGGEGNPVDNAIVCGGE